MVWATGWIWKRQLLFLCRHLPHPQPVFPSWKKKKNQKNNKKKSSFTTAQPSPPIFPRRDFISDLTSAPGSVPFSVFLIAQAFGAMPTQENLLWRRLADSQRQQVLLLTAHLWWTTLHFRISFSAKSPLGQATRRRARPCTWSLQKLFKVARAQPVLSASLCPPHHNRGSCPCLLLAPDHSKASLWDPAQHGASNWSNRYL